MIYFMQLGISGPIKIGYSANPADRRKRLQRANDRVLSLEAILPGDLRVERALHEKFAVDRLAGEWFVPSAAPRNFVSSAQHFEGFWPEDQSSGEILDVLVAMAQVDFIPPFTPFEEWM